MSFDFKTIQLDQKQNGIWILTINRPQALNALNSALLDELGSAIRQISEMDFESARVLLITGSGEKAFVAGADIKEMTSLSPEQAQEFARKGQRVFQELNFLKIPVIAVVQGFALGGGCELALGCDFIYAGEKARFGLPEVGLGLIPGFGGTVRLSRAVGIRRARELTFTGKMIGADEAFAMGLVNRVIPQDQLMTEAMNTAMAMAKKAPVAIAHAKKSINRSWDLDVEAAQEQEAEHFGELFATQDMKEGTSAFLEKRESNFKGE